MGFLSHFALFLPQQQQSLEVKGVIKIRVLKAWYLQVVKENADVASLSRAGVLD